MTTTSTAANSSTNPLIALFSPQNLLDNPLFAGGLGLAGLGASAAFARRVVIRSVALLRRRLLVTLEISKQDASYPWILAWLSLPRPAQDRLSAALGRVNNLSMKTTAGNGGGSGGGGGGGGGNHDGGVSRAHFFLQPGYGRYAIQHGRAWVGVQREKVSQASLDGREPHEIVTLTTLYAHRHVFEDIFREAHQLAASAREGKTVMYTARGMEWLPFGDARRKRPLESVVLETGVKERIVADVQDFLRRQDWYTQRGIPYRRGYLLHGPPGSGKSSFIQALAGHLDFGIAIVNLSERGLTDDRLAHLLTRLPRRTILLLEDADAAFINRQQVGADGYGGGMVTFSGLLNALDGVAAGEERISFLTTNHVDRLDPALVRPGRVDMTVRIGEATREQAQQMFERFYPDTESAILEKFMKTLEEKSIVEAKDAQGARGMVREPTSTAALQSLFLFNKDDPLGAVQSIQGLVSKTESQAA